ncbi:MAG: TdeIII family type II restriction endonuclease [Ignavibacteriae bacterium]|nr:TdeIII family type II restriction endonuclease [Ignavibacteriota bacterium]
MSFSKQQKEFIEGVIGNCLREKFKNYKPESNNMPFHFRLLGKDRMALYSFIQSLNTTFGTSIFEPVAIALAKNHFKRAESQFVVGNSISEGCQQAIQEIMNELTVGKTPNKQEELKALKHSATKGKLNTLRTVKVDLLVESHDGEVYFIDLKTAKPNISNFKDFKRTLLEWAGIALTTNPKAQIHTLVAIPYNPYEPKPYERWTLKGMLDLEHELKVAEEFWNFLGGNNAYEELLACFERVGIALRPEIDKYFSKFK